MAKILAVDDSLFLRHMLSFTLNRDGHEVTEAEDGLVALRIAREKVFDLVVTDINMPNMDGITLIAELRKLREFKATPLLLLTTEFSEEKKQAGKLAGATGWIVKPFNPEQLLAAIKCALN